MNTQLISLEYIANLDLYKVEKPYFLAQAPGFETEGITNLKYSTEDGITLSDCRGYEKGVSNRYPRLLVRPSTIVR